MNAKLTTVEFSFYNLIRISELKGNVLEAVLFAFLQREDQGGCGGNEQKV